MRPIILTTLIAFLLSACQFTRSTFEEKNAIHAFEVEQIRFVIDSVETGLLKKRQLIKHAVEDLNSSPYKGGYKRGRVGSHLPGMQKQDNHIVLRRKSFRNIQYR